MTYNKSEIMKTAQSNFNKGQHNTFSEALTIAWKKAKNDIRIKEIENELLRFEYIKETVVYAEDGVIVAEVFFDPENAKDSADKLDDDILRLNKLLPIYKNIGKIKVRDIEFPKTTTKKIKREYKADNNVQRINIMDSLIKLV